MADEPDQQRDLDELSRLAKRVEELTSQEIPKATKAKRAPLEQELQDALTRMCELKTWPKPPDRVPPPPPPPDPDVPPPGVQQRVFCKSIGRGKTVKVPKTVRTPPLPLNPDIVFLADTTGSMGSAIADVQAKIRSIVNDVKTLQPSAHFGVAEYKDIRKHEGITGKDDHPFPFRVDQALTADADAVQAAVNRWKLTAGYTTPEAQLLALHKLATAAETGWRTDSSRIIVWFGDEPGHDPLEGISLSDVTTALTDANILVIAISTGFNELDKAVDAVPAGQASHITEQTGGVLATDVRADEVANAIMKAIKDVEVTVTPQVEARGCDKGLSVTFSPTSQTVAGGSEATFEEIITVDINAPEGATLACLGSVHFLIDDKRQGPEFDQTVVVNVNSYKTPDDEDDACAEKIKQATQDCEARIQQLTQQIANLQGAGTLPSPPIAPPPPDIIGSPGPGPLPGPDPGPVSGAVAENVVYRIDRVEPHGGFPNAVWPTFCLTADPANMLRVWSNGVELPRRLWQFEAAGQPGEYRIRDRHNGLYIDADQRDSVWGAAKVNWQTSDDSQVWKLQDVPDVSDGYAIVSKKYPDRALDLADPANPLNFFIALTPVGDRLRARHAWRLTRQ